ncbi:hypothetical protein I7I53_11999 [Histoplasma capsulatum var. duboisii H88]|uniref:Uncharacterized protein n=1 Tax=Ajellomyces capsulatus (strain H88) TaxID=544711 RepID=A0A8A1LZ95_AJEC8|nr:hypothetical protein I7I53_11999 [Histoplasma capsulatum var. duboisii H88]
MHQENNRRRTEDARLIGEESKFPALNQTPARKEAEARKMARIQAARMNTSWSVMQKQLEKDSAEQEYNQLLQVQALERVSAAGKQPTGT